MDALRRLRVALATLVAIGSFLMVGALPASAAIVLVDCTGTCGVWHVRDIPSKQDVRCILRNSSPHDLYEMTIRPPVIYGAHSGATTVDWRFLIQTKKLGGYSQHYHTIYTSGYQVTAASDSSPASGGHGFSKGTWLTGFGPNNHGSVQDLYRIAVEMQWWHNGAVEGFTRIGYYYNKEIRLDGTHVFVSDAGLCYGALGG